MGKRVEGMEWKKEESASGLLGRRASGGVLNWVR
jgi:hypothetical protein